MKSSYLKNKIACIIPVTFLPLLLPLTDSSHTLRNASRMLSLCLTL